MKLQKFKDKILEQLIHMIEEEIHLNHFQQEKWEIYESVIMELIEELLLEVKFALNEKEMEEFKEDLKINIHKTIMEKKDEI